MAEVEESIPGCGPVRTWNRYVVKSLGCQFREFFVLKNIWVPGKYVSICSRVGRFCSSAGGAEPLICWQSATRASACVDPVLDFVNIEINQGWLSIKEEFPDAIAVRPADGGSGEERLQVDEECS